jgi:hypothetical protein
MGWLSVSTSRRGRAPGRAESGGSLWWHGTVTSLRRWAPGSGNGSPHGCMEQSSVGSGGRLGRSRRRRREPPRPPVLTSVHHHPVDASCPASCRSRTLEGNGTMFKPFLSQFWSGPSILDLMFVAFFAFSPLPLDPFPPRSNRRCQSSSLGCPHSCSTPGTPLPSTPSDVRLEARTACALTWTWPTMLTACTDRTQQCGAQLQLLSRDPAPQGIQWASSTG